MPEKVFQAAPAVGRCLLALIFVVSGFQKIGGFEQVRQSMEAHHMPSASLLLIGAIVVEIAGGLALMAGFQTRYAALLLFIFLVPATLIFHNFWSVDPEQQRLQMIMFLKNVAIMGGLIHVVGLGAGPWSIDALRRRMSADCPP